MPCPKFNNRIHHEKTEPCPKFYNRAHHEKAVPRPIINNRTHDGHGTPCLYEIYPSSGSKRTSPN